MKKLHEPTDASAETILRTSELLELHEKMYAVKDGAAPLRCVRSPTPF
jgi:hypothetical protein